MRRFLTPALLLAASTAPMALAHRPLAAQAAPGSVRGQVFDSTRSAPLEGARILLWGTSHEAVSDEEGHFEMPSVPPGEYSAVFFHPRLAELGVASGARPLDVEGDVEVSLGVPSRFTLAALACTGEGGVSLAGSVRDEGTGLALPAARVTLHWQDPDSARVRTAPVDADGWYRACGLPAGRFVAVSASFLDRTAARAEVTASEGSAVQLDLTLAPRDPSRVVATVREAGTGAPLPDARVVLGLSGDGRSGVTDHDGRAAFEAVPPGRYTLAVDHLAHEPRVEPVDVAAGARVQVEVRMAGEAIPLPPLQVEVEGVHDPARLLGGIQVTPEEIEAVLARSRDVADLLLNQRIPGVVVKRDYSGGVCVEFITGQSRMFRRACEPVMVIVDGVRVNDPNGIFSWNASVIERMQLFKPVDAGIFGLGGGSGVLVVTTKARNDR